MTHFIPPDVIAAVAVSMAVMLVLAIAFEVMIVKMKVRR